MSSNEQQRSFGWPHAVAVTGAVGLLLAAILVVLFLRSVKQVGETAVESGRQVISGVQEIARAFTTGTITTSFVSYATEVTGSNYLQFATLNQREIFTRTDSATTLWGQLELPDIVVEATADVQYTYYLDLNGHWEFELEGNRIEVKAPEIGFNRPAIDASSLEYEVRQDSLLRDEDEALEALRIGLTEMAGDRARENVELIREIGRRKTEEFVANWLFRDFGEELRKYDVRVVFPDELPDASEALQIRARD